jgi:hypothetical protein
MGVRSSVVPENATQVTRRDPKRLSKADSAMQIDEEIIQDDDYEST